MNLGTPFNATTGMGPHTTSGVGGMRGLSLSQVMKFLGGICVIATKETARKTTKLCEDEDKNE